MTDLVKIVVATQRCYHCREIKPLAAFYRNRRRPSGYDNGCRTCKNAFRLARYHRQQANKRRCQNCHAGLHVEACRGPTCSCRCRILVGPFAYGDPTAPGLHDDQTAWAEAL